MISCRLAVFSAVARVKDCLGRREPIVEHTVPCAEFPWTDCEGCDVELHEAIYRLKEGHWLSFSWIPLSDHSPIYDNIGMWDVDETMYLELGRQPAMFMAIQNDDRTAYPII